MVGSGVPWVNDLLLFFFFFVTLFIQAIHVQPATADLPQACYLSLGFHGLMTCYLSVGFHGLMTCYRWQWGFMG